MRPARHAAALTVLAFLAAVGVTPASAARLDPAFGDRGTVLVSFGGQHADASDIEAMPDGRLVAAGLGGDGRVVLRDRPGLDEQARDATIQPDGKIVVVGDSGDATVVVRVSGDGTPDASFGDGGSVVLPTPLVPSAVVVQPNGGIVVAGGTIVPGSAYDIAVTRLLSDGTLDASFGAGGRTVLPFGAAGAIDGIAAHGMALLPDGGILATGFAIEPDLSSGDLGLMRLTPGGAPDPTLGSDGDIAVSVSSGGDRGAGVVVAGSTTYLATDSEFRGAGERRRLAVLALRADGSREVGFAPGGVFEVSLGDMLEWRAAVGLAQRPDGRLALLSRGSSQTSSGFAIALIDPAAPPPPPPARGAGPRSRIARIPPVVRPRRVRRFVGTARAAAGVDRVELALVRRFRAARGRPVCGLLRRDRRHFRRVARSADGRCAARIWIRAAGTHTWQPGRVPDSLRRVRRGVRASGRSWT